MMTFCVSIGCGLCPAAEKPSEILSGSGVHTGALAAGAARISAGATGSVETSSTNLMVRDPFWPVGYSPGQEEPANLPAPQVEKRPEAPPRWKEATRSLRIKGVLRVSAGKYVAMINDRIVGEGDLIEAFFSGRKYRWRIKSVSREGVGFQPLESELVRPAAE